MTKIRCAVRVSLLLAAGLTAMGSAAAAPQAEPLSTYLATWKLDRPARAVLEEPSAWNDAKLQVALRLLARLGLAPADAFAAWCDAATAWPAAPGAALDDGFVRLEGRVVFVAPLILPEEQAEIAGRKAIDVVRLKTGSGEIVDVIAEAVPAAWPRWRAIDEPASVVGLPLTTGSGPSPGPPPANAEPWPAEPHALLLAARRVAWHPATPLGRLSMDYGLFDTVADGQKLVPGDTDAFYAMLAAAGRGTQAGIEQAAGPVADTLPMIDPKQRWFQEHRGDAITVEGTARRATRIEIDDPRRRRELGTDHYWELFVFVPTSLIKINDRLQETYPLVCCVRKLPAGMPTGQTINERVRVSGFALKRYGYPLPRVKGQEAAEPQRQETPLIIGRQAIWVPEPSQANATSLLGWAFMLLAGLIGLVLAFGAWRFNRDARLQRRRLRDALPDKIELP